MEKDSSSPNRVPVADGSPVHNAGELIMHVANWGMMGSMPGSSMPFAQAPSAEWPSGSGVEHLYVAGLWVAAVVDGIPSVSTGAFEFEFRPTEEPADTIYRAAEGDAGGNRAPFLYADDDGDGLIDEDWLDGRDNDGDGLVDEDYAAISNQMFSCWYTDNQPVTLTLYPDHRPLNLMVREESYQWSNDDYDDFVGFEYKITNVGTDVLENVYIGILVDPDVGNRSTPYYWNDDAAGFWRGNICTPEGMARLDVAYGYDADGDGGNATSYLGVVILDHPTDPAGQTAPSEQGATTYANFSGDQPFDEGGEPTNDFERYELMSSNSIGSNASVPRDYQMLLSVGPFSELMPESTLVIRTAFVAGTELTGMLQNAARAQLAFNGKWFDVDGDPLTGVDGRETLVSGPATGVVIDPCRPALSDPIDVPSGQVLWINTDCEEEAFRAETCSYGPEDSLIYKTGVAGRETNVHWTISSQMPPVQVAASMDIKPGSTSNPFNVKLFDFMHENKPKKGGVLPLAVLGNGDFDVHDIDISSVRLEGVAPLPQGRSFEDVSGPDSPANGCSNASGMADGYDDLSLKFRSIDVALAISIDGQRPPVDGMQLSLTGKLNDGTEFSASDCITFVGKMAGPSKPDRREIRLQAPYPNPFNPVTRISYYLPNSTYVLLSVYDVTGRLVEVLQDGYQNSGDKVIPWNAGRLASGVYFYRLQAEGKVIVRRAVLLK